MDARTLREDVEWRSLNRIQRREVAARLVEEQMRRASARTTEHIARHLGERFPMWIGCGFPKSGTVWLCRLMANYLGVPYPQNYALPIAMRSVVHAHWNYHPGLPAVGYIVRDGRDVAVSLYHHQMKVVRDGRHPRAARRLSRRFEQLWGPSFDPTDVEGNLPRFIEAEWADPAMMRMTWSSHIRDWVTTSRPDVTVVRYERLLAEPQTALVDLMSGIEKKPADPLKVDLAIARNDFELASGRSRGAEDVTQELRKGIVGDWRNVFTREARTVFDQVAGADLERLGYELDSSWVDDG